MKFAIWVKCNHCQGVGKIESILHEEDIMLIVHDNVGKMDGKLQKVEAIKQVRKEYGLALISAKVLVEGAMVYYEAIKEFATYINPSRDEVLGGRREQDEVRES